MSQEIKDIKISDLHLWSENPRDPISSSNYCEEEIIKLALLNHNKKWDLDKLLNAMGTYYDLSELPTVVLDHGFYTVYDGNRRIAIIKFLQNRSFFQNMSGYLIPPVDVKNFINMETIPCNVCDKETALSNVERKHIANGSWKQLERDYFSTIHRGKERTLFQIINDSTNLISNNQEMNQGFVKNEILTIKNLNSIGFDIQDGRLVSVYTPEIYKVILDDIVNIIKNSKITTRKNRGLLKDTLLQHNSSLKNIIKPFDKEQIKGEVCLNNNLEISSNKNTRKTPKQNTRYNLFGGNLYLKPGKVNDLYRAIDKIYSTNPTDDTILPIIGMSLRLLLEIAAREHFVQENLRCITKGDKEIYRNFVNKIKKEISQESLNYSKVATNFLNSSANLEALLGKYAHGEILYDRTNIIQTSFVVAEILKKYFGK